MTTPASPQDAVLGAGTLTYFKEKGAATAFQQVPGTISIGQVGGDTADRQCFQEVDYRAMYAPLAKWVAQIERACVGGGLDIALAADMRLAAGDAFFSVKEVDVGMVADHIPYGIRHFNPGKRRQRHQLVWPQAAQLRVGQHGQHSVFDRGCCFDPESRIWIIVLGVETTFA